MNTNCPEPAPGTKVIKAADYHQYLAAADIIAAAEQRAAQIEADARAVYQEQKEKGYQDGLEAGRLEHSEKIFDTVMASVEFIENIEQTAVNVVSQSIRKIIGDLDDRDRIVRIVHTALSAVRGQHKVTVRVAPCDEPAVSEALAAMTSSSFVTVIADARLTKDSCILESELGVVNASLETQLKALEHAFSSKIEKR